MGNAIASEAPVPDPTSALLRLRKGKKNVGCPCFLADEASTWEAVTHDPKFRPYVLRHLLDEGFICSVLEHGERENSLTACAGVHYYKYTEESQRGILREKLEAWQRAAGAGVTACEGLNSESAFGELQLARPLRTYGFLPTIQRRLAVLRELGAAVAEEHRSRCRPFHMRSRSPPPPAGGRAHGDVCLGLMMNSVALQSLSTLASLATVVQAVPAGDGSGHGGVDLIRAPFAMLADLLEKFPAQNLFKYWSPLPSEPERRLPVDPETATASCSASLARLAVTGGVHVGWKSTSTGSSVVTWQVALSAPATDLTSVQVQWRAGDPSTGTDQNALPLALSIEASVDGGKEWHGITGGDEAVDVALAHKASPGSSQHRYPVSLLALRRKTEPRRKALEGRSHDVIPAVTHVRLKMRGAPGGRPGGALSIYDVAINARDPSASPSDVMTVLRQLQTFLLAQHSRDEASLQEYILRALLGVCQASCALEFELDLVRVYMDMENSGSPSLLEEEKGGGESTSGAGSETQTDKLGQTERLQAFVSTLLSAACRAKRQACRQDRERVVRDAAFDPALSSKWVVVSEEGQLVSSAADNGHSHSLLHQCLRRGTWSWELALERESSGDETTCVGVAVNPVTNSCYEDSHQMWMVRCYSGETYSNGGRRNRVTRKIHPLDSVRLTLNCECGTLSLEVNGVDQGVVFSNVPPEVHPAVCFYGVAKSVRLVELKRIFGDCDGDVSDSDDESDAEMTPVQTPPVAQHEHQPRADSLADTGDGDASASPAEAVSAKKQACVGADSVSPESPDKASRQKAARREAEEVASTIRAATAAAPSAGLLASLANFAQWYVPHDQEGDQLGPAEHGSGRDGVGRSSMTPAPGSDPVAQRFPAAPAPSTGGWGVVRSGVPPEAGSGRHLGINSNDLFMDFSLAVRQSSSGLFSSMIPGRPLPARRMSTTAAGTRTARSIFARGEVAEHRRVPAQATTTAVGVEAATATQGRKGKGKPLALEEPYIIQPTAAVFQKLYGLLVRSLARLDDGTDADKTSTASSVLSLLQIMRANFCRLVDAHVDPAEVGLLLNYHRNGVGAASEASEQSGDEKLLPDILHCLQGIMLKQDGDPSLLRATVDTFTSGLPLLMPLVQNRLHLLLGLVWHLQSSAGAVCDIPEGRGAAEDLPDLTSTGRDASTPLAQIPRERVTLLRDLLTHFARTDSVLQLLTLFEEDEAERSAVSDLLELMLTSMADRACQSASQQGKGNNGDLVDAGSSSRPASGKSDGRPRSYWDQLVAGGAGGTTLSYTLLDTCQQHLLCMVLERDCTANDPYELLLCQYGQCLLQVCCRVLSAECPSTDTEAENDESPWWKLVGVLLPPFLHGLCMCVDRPRVAEGMLPSLVRLSEVLSHRISRIPREAAAASYAEDILRQTQLTNPEEGLALTPSGWHPVRASFEVDKDSMTSFSISEDGQLYSALTSNNTCALLDVGVSHGKAAWEFLLEDDSPSDECSVFGIATKPPYSRCYNSSQSLWMRRAYNGVLYNRGRQLPAGQSMSKIHPGDVVRCEVDMDEGTLRFSVNGEKQDGGFDDVEGEVFPCAGSYRSGVTIRLLKMEMMGGIGLGGGGDLGAVATGSDPTEISWAPSPCSKRTRNGLVAIDKKAIEMKRMATSCSLHQAWAPRPAASNESDSPSQAEGESEVEGEGEGGSDNDGAPSTTAELSQTAGPPGATAKQGMTSPDAHADVGKVEVADVDAWDWVSVRATRGFAALEGKHSVEMEVTPVGARRRRAIGSTKSSGSEDRSALRRRYPMAFGLCAGTVRSLEAPIGQLRGSWGWWTDGSLRAHGKVLFPTEAAGDTLYGSEFLPLKPLDVITMVTDTVEGTLRYLVNGMDAGIAFGPAGSGAVCELPDGQAPFEWDAGAALFPSCSLTNDKQMVQLRPGGTLGTQLWPLSVDLHKTVASLVGRLCATLIAGTPQDEAETALEPWLRSPLLSGGVNTPEDMLGESVWRSLGHRSWDQAWSAEQQGRLGDARPGMPGADFDPTVADETFVSGDRLSQSVPDGSIRLTARIVEATKIPKGLVLWPDAPCVRVTATVDGRSVSCQEELLNVCKPSSPVTSRERVELNQGESSKTHPDGRPEQGELELQLRWPQMQALIDGADEDEYLPALSLRVEVLVGRVVTAAGEVDLGGELKASLSGAGSKRTVLSLTGGGEMVFALQFRRESVSSLSPQEAQPQRQGGVSTLSSVWEDGHYHSHSHSQTKDESVEVVPIDARLEHFLESIAGRDLTGGVKSPASRVDSSSSPVVCSAAETSSVGVAAGESSLGGRRKAPEDGHDSLLPDLMDWLGRSNPDPAFLRMALEKTDSYSFPLVEAPFLAALLKHSGLVGEAFHAAEMMSAADKGKRTLAWAAGRGSSLPVPTRDMAKLWARIRQLRAFLRTQKQEYKVTAVTAMEGMPSEASAAEGGGAPSRETEAMPEAREVVQDEKSDVEAEAEEKEALSSDAQAVDREAFPSTFDELCRQMAERAKFLLELSPSTVQSPSAAAEGTSALMQHLAEEISDLPMPSPGKLQSRLLRWRSEDRGNERWKGVVDVLRVRSQLRRSLSSAHRPRAKSLGNRPAETAVLRGHSHGHGSERNVNNPCIEEGQTFAEEESSSLAHDSPRARTCSLGLVGEDSSVCSSGDDSDDSGNGPLLDNETAASAAIQACTIYVVTGGAAATPRALKASLRSRTARAAMRTFGLQALAALLGTLSPAEQGTMSVGTSSAVQQEALVFLRPAFQGLRVKRDKEGREVEVTSDARDTRHHYLKGLEGCSAGLLARVQGAFEDLYGLLRTLLDHSLRTGQPGLAHVLMTSWALDFESRDYRFLAHKSGILPTLQAMVTLTNTASLASSSLDSLNDTSHGPQKDTRGSKTSTGLQSWTPWSLETVRGGFMQGTLMARDVARHISRIPPSALPSGFLEAAGLHGTASDILGRHSMAALLRRYSALLRVHLKHAEARVTKMDQEAASRRKRLEEVGRERVTQMVARGIPVLDEREGKKSPEVQLTALCSWATVPAVASVACTFARGVTYACTPAGAALPGVAPSSNSGNYFEVTVMNPGEKTTIGIGLADPDVFPATKQMPGWIDHSYGYHGDDGRLFGRAKTDSIWPTWVDGDVIGCGFDPVRGSIWYTRNGELLGDGFVPVYESNLVPVVGFHSNGESVRINFGVAPFAYEGPEVVISPAVLAERQLLQREAQDLNPAEEKGKNADDDDGDETADEKKTEGGLAEEKERSPMDGDDDTVPSAGHLGERAEAGPIENAQKEITPQMMVPSMRVLQRGASSLLRFLVAVSMRQAPLASSVGPEEVGLQASSNEEPRQPEDTRQIERGGQERSSPNVDGGAAAAALPPTRERSMYGTPLKQMQTHVDNLHQDVFDLILRELRLGALSLEHIVSTSSRMEARELANQNFMAFDGDGKAPSVSKPLAVGRAVKPEMQRSYSHGHTQAAAGRWNGSIAWKGLGGTAGFGREREDASAQTLGLLALEVGEVEPHMFRQLALLCSVRQYAIARTQLAHPSALRSIFSLLKVGSPRMQRCVLLLLGAVLPGMEPTVVDDYLPEGWRGRNQTGVATSSTSSGAGSRKDREVIGVGQASYPADGLVGVLFSTVRHAYSTPPSLPGKTPSDSAGTVDTGAGMHLGNDSAKDQSSRGQRQGWLSPGCNHGFGGGTLDVRLAEQCSSLLRELYKEPAWKERIARKLLLSIRTAASSIRASSASPDVDGPRTGFPCSPSPSPPTGQALPDVISDAVAALAIIAGGSGVLYPGAKVQSKSGVRGTVVLFSAGDAEAGVVFDGENVENCERVLVRDLETAGVGFCADPDTPAQPVVAQLLSLLAALLHSNEVSQALKVVDAGAMVWLRVLSQCLMAVLQLSVQCSDAVVAACREGDVVANVLPHLLEVAVCPVQLPALITAQDFQGRWRSAQARMLSALRLGRGGLRTMRPIHRHPLPPPPEAPTTSVESRDKAIAIAPTGRPAHSPADGRDALSAEESREEALLHPRRQIEYSDPILEVARSARSGGRGRLMTLGDPSPHRGWGRGWGSGMSGRRVVGVRGALDWAGRVARDEDDSRREGSRRRLMRSDLSHRLAARGRRAASAESRLDPRRAAARGLLDYDGLEGFAEYREDESGALLVEFNDGADGEGAEGREAPGLEGGSAASADSGDTSQDGDEMENTTSNVDNRGCVLSTDEATDSERTTRPRPEPPRGRGAPSESRGTPTPAPALEQYGEEQTVESRPTQASAGFSITHLLEFGTEARAERQELSARLSSEVGVPGGTALSALEAFGADTHKARTWLQKSQHPTQLPGGEVKVSVKSSSVPSGVGENGTNGTSDTTTEDSIVSGLIGADESGPPRGGGEAASVPSADEGLNLWESEGGVQESTTPCDMISMQCAGLLCEHDLVPVLGLPRPPTEIGGTTGTGTAVTTSSLVREADLLEPGSLLMVTAGEGYAPDKSCPCVTVASEMDFSAGSGRTGGVARDKPSAGDMDASRGAECRAERANVTRPSKTAVAGNRWSPPQSNIANTTVVDNDEVLVEMMDAETGLCLGKRVPVGDLRHSKSFFGRELDSGGNTVKQLLGDTDKALATLRARSLLVRLIQSIPTPAVSAAGGPHGLLNITRLLAAQDLAKGKAPASFGSVSDDGGNDADQASVGSVAGDQDGHPVLPRRCSKLVYKPPSDQDSLLKMLWRKVMDSPEQWASSEEQGAGSAILGEMLAQEVLDSFNTLTTTSQVMLSGGWPPRENSGTHGSSPTGKTKKNESGGAAAIEEGTFATESITHESLHPLCTPLSYGGHIKVDAQCLGMVIKLDSRSRTPSDLVRLRFFSSKEDMLNERDPVRVMHGHAVERAARAKAKGMEFFKIEEADSTCYESASPSAKELLSLGALARLTPPLPPPLPLQLPPQQLPPPPPPPPPVPPVPPASVPQERASSIGPGSSPGTSGSSRRHVLTSRAMTRTMCEAHSQIMARRKTRSKETPALTHTNLGSSFRSFALPGVHELWFRFDAPPGAEKPLLQIASVFGSLALAAPGVVRASATPDTPSTVIATATCCDRDEDLSQEELGLQALFTCVGEERERERGDDSSSPTHVKDGSRSSESRRQGIAELPGCLATAADVCLTSGRWFYEATVGSLVGSMPDGGDADDGLVRVGWAHVDLPVSLRAGDFWKDESKRSDMGEEVPRSTTGSSEVASASSATPDNDERSRRRAKWKGVTFPILGSDVNNLGVGLGQEGGVWLGGRSRAQKAAGFSSSDVVGCAIDVDSGAVWFSVNGRCAGGNLGEQESAVNLKKLGWGHDGGLSNGITPCFSVRGGSFVSVNFGTKPFKFPPPGQEFLPVILRDVLGAEQEIAALTSAAAQTSDKRVTFAPEAKLSSAASGAVPDDWGFRFVVDPLRGVHYRVVRDLELICRFGGRLRSGNPPSANSTFGPQTISIWRPKAPPGWFSVGDVASRGLSPPPGAVVVRADATGCMVSKPAKFRVVHQDKATGFVVWRPVARQGQVSLGDFACAKKASKGIMAGAVRCVAAWAVEACPVVECLWREEKQSGTHAIWSAQNGLGTFFGSQTGGRMGKKEVTQGPHSRVERQKRKKKKKKKKKGSAGEESSEEDEGERIKLQPGVGEGWALKGVSASCITNEWCQESDVISGPAPEGSPVVPPIPAPAPPAPPSSGVMNSVEPEERRTDDEEEAAVADIVADMVRKPQPSVSWASWLLSFLLSHPPLRRLAMRGALFRTLVAYLRSPGAPHRLRMVPLLTLLVRSHAEFADSPPPLEELSGLLAAVLRECDKLTCGRGPRSAAWRSGDCPGGVQLETSWANEGLLLLTDLAIATRRAQDAITQRSLPQLPPSETEGKVCLETTAPTPELVDAVAVAGGDDAKEEEEEEEASGVRISLPPFGTRPDEGPVEEAGLDEAEEVGSAERGLGDRILVGGRSLGAEDRARLEVDLRNSVLPDLTTFAPPVAVGPSASVDPPLQGAEATAETPSRCLQHLLEIMDTLGALRDGWPSSPEVTATSVGVGAGNGPLHLDAILCEAWMDAVGPAVVVESDHPFRKGTYSETLHLPGAEEMVVFLDPRSSMQEGTASLVLEGKDKMISLTGQQEAPWGDVITFRGDSITYRFVAQADGEVAVANSLVTGDPEVDDWGFRFTVVADGPVWECARLQSHGDQVGAKAVGEAPGHETRLRGALSLLVEVDQMHPVPPNCSLQVLGFSPEGTPVHAGLLTESGAQVPIYVQGDKVRIVPSQECAARVDLAADSKDSKDSKEDDVLGGSKAEHAACESKDASTAGVMPAHGELGAPLPAPGTPELLDLDLDTLPDADAKLDRLPSNTPVLGAWGEATGVEQRWRSASGIDVPAFHGASYVSNAATVEVADSDAESKDGSSNNNSPSTSLRERGAWPRCSTLDRVIATALPMLEAVSSDMSDMPDLARPGVESVAAAIERSVAATNASLSDAPVHEVSTLDEVDPSGVGEVGDDGTDESSRGAAIRQDLAGECASVNSSKPRECAGAKDVAEGGVNNASAAVSTAECSSSRPWEWAVRVQAAAMPRQARLRLFLDKRLSLQSRGGAPSLQQAREWMKAWTPAMDKGLLDLLDAASGEKSQREEAASGRVAEALNPWCCMLTRAEAKFQQQRLAAVPAASLHIRAALLLRLNDRIERVLPVIDLASRQADSLGWQLREMNHLVLPHIKVAVLEAALIATQ
ncbi:unnamed protein product, partial [Ectocarpus fasciculatus]